MIDHLKKAETHTENSASDFCWDDTLQDFLKASNEDEIIVRAFNEHVFPLIIQQFHNHLEWLEIGCGDFQKTFEMLSLFKKQYSRDELEFQVIEPSVFWKNNFVEKYADQVEQSSNFEFISSKLEDCVSSNTDFNFDLISLIQVLYEKEVTQAFFDMLDKMLKKKRKSIFFVSVESENSHFASIRRELAEHGFEVPETKHTYLESELIKREINFSTLETTDKKCKIDFEGLSINSDYWLYPFLLGISKKAFAGWAEEKKNCAREIIRNRIISLDTESLSINDIIFIIETNE